MRRNLFLWFERTFLKLAADLILSPIQEPVRTFCYHCALIALHKGEDPQVFEEDGQGHAIRCHPPGLFNTQRREELDKHTPRLLEWIARHPLPEPQILRI